MKTKVYKSELRNDDNFLLLTPEKENFIISNDYQRIEEIFFTHKTVGEAWNEFFDGIWKSYSKEIKTELLVKKERIKESGVSLFVAWRGEGDICNVENRLVQSLNEGLECFELHNIHNSFSSIDCEISDIFLDTKRLIEFEILEYSDKEISSRTSLALTVLAMIYLQL